MKRAPCGAITVLGIAIFLAICSLAMLAISFATNHWIEVEVDTTAIDKIQTLTDEQRYNRTYYLDRDRGLFRTCYKPYGNAKFLDYKDDVVDGNCQLEQGYELSDKDREWGDEYDNRIHLLRCHFCFFVIGLLFLIAACICGLVGCWNVRVRLYLAAGICAMTAALFTLGGMIIFHVYWDYEENDIDNEDAGFPAYWNGDPKGDTALLLLQKYTDMGFGYSYYLGWISMALSFIAMVLFFGASAALKSAKRQEKEPLMDFVQPSAHSYSYPRPSIVAKPMPALMPPPMPIMTPQLEPMRRPTMMGDPGMIPVVPVGPPVVPVLPITDVYPESTFHGGYDYDYPDYAMARY